MHLNCCYSSLNCLVSWYDLASIIGVKTNILSWVLQDNFQHRIVLNKGTDKERIVYKSEGPLKFVQLRLVPFFNYLFNCIDPEETKHIVSYRTGMSYIDYIKGIPHAKQLITFDIRKYFDNIRFEHISKTLQNLGMQESGANLVTRYCTVRDTRRLQQGSPCSPVISNLVGYYFIDKPVKTYLKENLPNYNYTYVRYCDNIAIFIHDNALTLEESDNLKTTIKDKLFENNFKTHDWNCISDNYPYKNQKFLGIVKNNIARTEKGYYNKFRGLLFRICLFGFKVEAYRFVEDINCLKIDREYIDPNLLIKQFKRFILGHINYIKRISDKQGLVLKKLYRAAEYLDTNLPEWTQTRNIKIINAINKYRANETVTAYLDKLKNTCEGIKTELKQKLSLKFLLKGSNIK